MQSTFLPLASTTLQVENRRRYLIEDFHADSAILIPLLLMPRDKVRPWTWNGSRELAAQLVADKQLTNFEIARRAGVSDSQLNRWKLRSRVRFTRHRARRHVPRQHHHHRPGTEREPHCRQESARGCIAAGRTAEGGSLRASLPEARKALPHTNRV